MIENLLFIWLEIKELGGSITNKITAANSLEMQDILSDLMMQTEYFLEWSPKELSILKYKHFIYLLFPRNKSGQLSLVFDN